MDRKLNKSKVKDYFKSLENQIYDNLKDGLVK